jgi:cholesterol transport system auxiliary component
MCPVTNKVQNKISLAFLCAALASCGPLVKIGESGPAPQRFTLTLAPGSTAPIALPSLRVEDLETPAELASSRMAVRVGAQEVRYVTGGVWTDRPSRLLRGLISEALRTRSSGLILSPAQSDIVPTYRLTGRLTAFQADAADGVARAMIIRSEQLLVDARSGKVIASQRFEAREAAASDRPADLASAANRAANRLATEVSDWAAIQLSGR